MELNSDACFRAVRAHYKRARMTLSNFDAHRLI
jgi:hypothetical protein